MFGFNHLLTMLAICFCVFQKVKKKYPIGVNMWLTTCILYTYVVVFERPVWVLQCVEDSFLFSCHKVLCLFLLGQTLPLWKQNHVMSTNVLTFQINTIYRHTSTLWKLKSNVIFLIPLWNICWYPLKLNNWMVGRANRKHVLQQVLLHLHSLF